MTKGSISWIAITSAVAILTAIILGLALDTGNSVREKIKIETVNITANRIGSTAYMIGALDQARVGLNLKEEYGFTKKGDGIYINYTSGSMALAVLSNKGKRKIRSPVNLELKKEGYAKNLCLVKKSGLVEIRRGSCS